LEGNVLSRSGYGSQFEAGGNVRQPSGIAESSAARQRLWVETLWLNETHRNVNKKRQKLPGGVLATHVELLKIQVRRKAWFWASRGPAVVTALRKEKLSHVNLPIAKYGVKAHPHLRTHYGVVNVPDCAAMDRRPF
jgi:hypothetical protein